MQIGAITAVRRKKPGKPGNFFRTAYKQRWLYLFALPCIVSYLVFSYAPMFGIVMSFQDFNPGTGFIKSPFVGLENFKIVFSMPQFRTALKNSFFISVLKLVIGFPLGIAFALFLNEIRQLFLKKTIQTITYMPYFISWVIVSGVFYKLLSIDNGVVNDILMALHVIKEPIFFFGESRYFYAIAVFTDNWKGLGFGAIYYLASIAGINPELYEAAAIDGAGRFRKMWHISLAGMRNMIVLFLILATSGLLSAGFDQIFTLSNINILEVSEILDTLVLKMLKTYGLSGLSVGSALGLFCSLVGLILFLIANYTAKALNENSVL